MGWSPSRPRWRWCGGTPAVPCGRWPGSAWYSGSSGSRLLVRVDELEVDLLKRVVRLTDRQHVGVDGHECTGGGGRGDRGVGHSQDVVAAVVLVPAFDEGEAAEHTARVR